MQKQECTLLSTSGLLYVDKTSFIKVPCSACGAFAPASMSVCPVDQNPLVQTAPHFDNGALLFPLISVLGEGGMGTVYKAAHPGLGKPVAIKVIHQTDPLSIKRFQLEAKALSRLNHKNLISVFDFGVSSAGSPYMIMESVDGQTLSHHNQVPPGLSFNQIIRIFRELASGLGQVHYLGLIHRDLKPENIILAIDPSGNFCPKLIDFGIAKSIDESPEASHLTMTGAILGSPIYMSPEQCCGEKLTHLTDIYSFGCMLFESISGQPPFRGKHFIETITLHATEEPPAIAPKFGYDVSPELSDLIYSCLEKNPADRPQSMDEIATTLASFDSTAQSTQAQVSSYHRRPISVQNNYLASEDQDEDQQEDQDESEPPQNSYKRLLIAASATVVTLALCFSLVLMSYNIANSKLGRNSNSYASNSYARNSQTNPADDSRSLSSASPATEKARLPALLDDDSLQKISKEWIEARINRKQLDIGGRYCVDDDVLKTLTKAKDIEILNLADDAVSDQSTKYYSHLPLRVLNLHRTGISDKSLKEISGIKTLRSLNIGSTAITDAGLSFLSAIPDLKELHLQKCALLTNRAGSALSQIKSLEVLDVSQTKVSNSFLTFVPSATNLTFLDISNTAITDAGFKHLEKSQLKSIDAANLQITPACIDSLKRMRALRKLNLSGCYQLTAKDVAALEAANPRCKIFFAGH